MSNAARKRVRRDLGLPVCRAPLPAHAEGYPLAYRTADGELLCPACVNANVALVDADRAEYRRSPGTAPGTWCVTGSDVQWEGPDWSCSHCNATFAAAHGDPTATV